MNLPMEWLRKLWVRAKAGADAYRVGKTYYDIIVLIAVYVGFKWEWIWNLIKSIKEKNRTYMHFPVNWVDWIFAVAAGLLILKNLWGWQRGAEKREIIEPAQENGTLPRQDPLLVVLVLHRHRDLAISQLLHRLIQNGEELRQWKAEFRQWRQNVERDLRRYCSRSDVEYFRAQEQVPSMTFASVFRSPSYGHQHGLDRTVLSRWITVLQELIDKYEKERPH